MKVLGADGAGRWGTVAEGIRWAADRGAGVIDLSIGAPRATDDLRAAVDYALGKGATVVAAAGNEGAGGPFYPAAYDGVVSVAGVDPRGTRYAWSNHGGWVSVSAPGCAETASLGGGSTPNFCGTSTAAPYVAGVAGLARSYLPGLTPAAYAAALEGTAAPSPDGTAAHGQVDANALLVALGAPAAPPALAAPPRLASRPVIGRKLVAPTRGWRDARSFAFRWQRACRGGVWQDVGVRAAYVPRRAEAGCRLRVAVTARNARGSTSTVSAATPPTAGP